MTARVPAGVPTGGQFAASHHAESTVGLTEHYPIYETRLGTKPWGATVVETLGPGGEPIAEASYSFDPTENSVEVRVISTAHGHTGRGAASTSLDRLAREHPDAVFDTESFASPRAKRLWIRALANHPGVIDATADDQRCDWCRRVLDDETDNDLCDTCSETYDEHADGDHDDDAPEGCWECRS